MKGKPRVKSGRTHSPLYVAAIVVLSGAGIASAADQASVATGPDGLMSFPHVQIVNKPELANVPRAAMPSGFKAYIDPATGQLRGPTQDDVQQEAAAGMASSQAVAEVNEQFMTPSGAIGLTLPESSMMFSVAQKEDDGSLSQFCVTGPEAAAKLILFKAPRSAALNRKEVRDVR